MTISKEAMETLFQASLEATVQVSPEFYETHKRLPPMSLFFMIADDHRLHKMGLPEWAFDNKEKLCRALGVTLRTMRACGFIMVMQAWMAKRDRIIGPLKDQLAPSDDPMRTEGIMIVSRSPAGKKRHISFECDNGSAECIIDTAQPGNTVEMLTPFADLLDR